MVAFGIPKPFLVLLAAIALLVAIPEEAIYVILCWIATALLGWVAVVAALRRLYDCLVFSVVMMILWNPWWYVPMPQIAWSAINLGAIAFLWWRSPRLSQFPKPIKHAERKKSPARPVDARVKVDPSTRSLSSLTRDAEGGDKRAQYEIGGRLLRGQGIEKDGSAAQQWYEKSAEQGYHKAQFRLGVLAEGTGDTPLARKWYRLAAAQNHPEARDALLRLGPAFGQAMAAEDDRA